ncbi:EI24 domain-containing protein [Emcibacter sp. SYSU 3D8]|uniref:EI24 domain-containing protein n=1 Tax=Emcibacter sp. SYSU 3D8 TaxID=3133969 RepID=UPI0031FE7F8D
MIDALRKSFGLFAVPAFWATALKVLLLTVPLAALAFWAGLELAGMLPGSSHRVLDWIIRVAGVAAALFGALLLFPALASVVVGLFADDIAEVTERRYYPAEPPGRALPLLAGAWQGVRAGLRLLAANLLALPVYLVLLPFTPLAAAFYLALNGWLLSREYFGMVAARHMDAASERALRRRSTGRIFLAGCLIAIMFGVPVLNLVAPLVGTALMVHVFKGVTTVART